MNEIDIDNDEIVLFTTNNKSNKNNNNKQDSTDLTDSSNNKNRNSGAVVSSNSFGLNTEDFKKMPFPYKVSIIYMTS